MKILIALFVLLAAVGLFKPMLAVTIISMLMIPFLLYADKLFRKQDKEWDRLHPCTPCPTEEILQSHSCNFM